ncbi:MAG: GAF domain-containing protein [Anaerolineae bacterium]|nr:GAF domain-containing protein [Anaerolineae bacterium]
MESRMRESEFKIEWLYSNLRWFFLLAVGAIASFEVISSGRTLPITVILLLVIGGIANMLVMVALLLNAFRRTMFRFTLILDIMLALGLILSSGGPNSPLLFMTLIPIITTALRYKWIVSIALAIVTTLIYWWSAWQTLDLAWGMSIETLARVGLYYFTNGLILLLAGGSVSFIGNRIKQTLTVEQSRQEALAQAAIEAAHQKVRLIFELASTLSATLNYERVLDAALDVSNAGFEELIGAKSPQVQIILLFGMDQSLYVATSRGLTIQDKKVRLPATRGVLAKTLERARPTLINDPGADPELGQFVAMHHCRQCIVVPLRAGFENYGVMVMASPDENAYPGDFRDLLEAVCNQAVMALQNARLYQNLMEEKERVVAVEEDERKKLARDLHDGPTQTIAAVAMRLNYIRMLIDQQPDEAMRELEQLEELTRKTTKEIRQMLFRLRPLILETQGLVAALEQYIAKLAETDPLQIHLEAQANADTFIDKESQGALFYMVEEAITNARKHARATDLWVRIYQRGMSMIAEIEDNGRGFDVAAIEENYDQRGSLGLLNLRERAVLVKGKTVIQSTPGEGTKVTIAVPRKERGPSRER